MEWPAQPFESSHCVTLIRKLLFLRELVWEHDVRYRWDASRWEAGGRWSHLTPSLGKSQASVRSPQVVLMKRTQYNTTLKPLRAQWCTSIILLLSYNNFHCLLEERKNKVLGFYLEWRAHHFLTLSLLVLPNEAASAPRDQSWGDKTSLRVGTEDLWLALENNGWCSLWILQGNLTEKDMFHLCHFLRFLAALQMIWNKWAYQ